MKQINQQFARELLLFHLPVTREKRGRRARRLDARLSRRSSGMQRFGLQSRAQIQRPEMAMPAGWSKVDGVGAISNRTGSLFWQDLGSVELNRSIDRRCAQNLDLEAALHRIEQARAQAKVAGSPFYLRIQRRQLVVAHV